MSRRFMERNDFLGTTKYWHYDPDTDTARIETVQDVEQLLDQNVAEYNEYTSLDRWTEKGIGRKVASIPMTVYSELLASGKIHDQAYMRRMLNDNGFRKFRTSPGRV